VPFGNGSEKTPLARFQEPHYTVAEIAETWKLSRDVVRKIFEKESGVFVIGNDGSRRKRAYHTLRIPESVMERVHRRLCNPDLTPERPRAYPSVKAGPPVAVNN
jgi:predicted transcriptional regulator